MKESLETKFQTTTLQFAKPDVQPPETHILSSALAQFQLLRQECLVMDNTGQLKQLPNKVSQERAGFPQVFNARIGRTGKFTNFSMADSTRTSKSKTPQHSRHVVLDFRCILNRFIFEKSLEQRGLNANTWRQRPS